MAPIYHDHFATMPTHGKVATSCRPVSEVRKGGHRNATVDGRHITSSKPKMAICRW
jgi:hypothetical protein